MGDDALKRHISIVLEDSLSSTEFDCARLINELDLPTGFLSVNQVVSIGRVYREYMNQVDSNVREIVGRSFDPSDVDNSHLESR